MKPMLPSLLALTSDTMKVVNSMSLHTVKLVVYIPFSPFEVLVEALNLCVVQRKSVTIAVHLFSSQLCCTQSINDIDVVVQ